MARPNLTLEEAEELAHFGIPAVPDVRMPSRWRLSIDGVPVAPVPEPGSHMFARAVGLYRARLSAAALEDPTYAPNNPAWPDILADDHEQHLHAFAGPRPPVKHNRARRHQLWDGRSFEEVVAPYRAQAASGALPAPTSAGFGLFRRGAARSTRFRHGGGGGDGAVLLGGGDRRTVAPRPAPRPARDGAGSSRAPPPEPALLAEYRRLAAQDGDPEDMPGLQTAIRESEMAVPPQLVQDYIQVAAVAGHPEDLPDFPGLHVAMADSVAPIIDVGSSSSDDSDASFGYDEEDLGGVDDE